MLVYLSCFALGVHVACFCDAASSRHVGRAAFSLIFGCIAIIGIVL